MTDHVSPVLIVGGGPVGLCAALELDHHGIPVTVVEPRTVVDHSRPRAKTTSARTMEHLRRWGIADRMRSAAPLPAAWSQRVTFVRTVVGKEITHLDDCLGLAVSSEISPETAQQVSQSIVEEVLREVVAERGGITTLFGQTVTRIDQDAEHVNASVVDERGNQSQLRSRWAIGADGPRSIVRAAMGTRYAGAAGGRPNVNITFRSRELAARIPHAPSIHYWTLDSEWPGVVGPLDLDGTWWAISTGTEHVGTVGEAVQIIRGLVGSDIDVEVIAMDPWRARMLLADDYRNGRLFVAGDAAHQNPPWGGHGFNTGVGDAVNLGWKLAAVINGWGPESLLDSYASERRPIQQQTIDLSSANMQALSIDLAIDGTLAGDSTTPEEFATRIREMKAPEFHAEGLVFGYGYTHHAAAQTPDQATYLPLAAAGNRLPHQLINDRPIFDLLGREFSVIGPREATVGLLAAGHAAGIPLNQIVRPGQVVLVRPDQHIAWSGHVLDDPNRILDDAIQGFRAPGIRPMSARS